MARTEWNGVFLNLRGASNAGETNNFKLDHHRPPLSCRSLFPRSVPSAPPSPSSLSQATLSSTWRTTSTNTPMDVHQQLNLGSCLHSTFVWPVHVLYSPIPSSHRRSPTPQPIIVTGGVQSFPLIRAIVLVWTWIYTQWAVLVFVKKLVTGADLDLDDDSHEDDKNVGIGKDAGRLRDEEDAVETLPPTRVSTEETLVDEDRSYKGKSRQRASQAVSVASSSAPSPPPRPDVPPSPPVVISLNNDFLDHPSAPSSSQRGPSIVDATDDTPQDPASSLSLELTPPTPHKHSTPLPLPQTLLLNPHATSLLTTYPRSRRRKDPDPNTQYEPTHSRTLTPITRNRTSLRQPKTLVLDLDETLIHSTSRSPTNASYGQGLFSAGGLGFGIGSGGVGFGIWGGRKTGPGHMVEVVLGGRSTLYHVYKRPFVDYFLKKVRPPRHR